ncbi:energy-coupling factor transporter transmembrane component T family protein [Clostridium luticellarii]|jgi:energy-coupling factor transport system permease protein|uniref:Energy-coupling factor transporter transmembrane protein EcfT n=1 Tax=Clostridium luticellarii TaxID=1691940 RepID=A0A2T0BS87_9CLOT|nr:energy-coupling factor transporter transmembrane component T [Clostridium luticellarii]MCI1944718.1 energy-coupling factor transporter transmembrane protein EcfT [Clostridium luticellarii]MCI1968215.1 energy-coupling factor transporter transmembrane protein EcfT [Clostridium luticellarii]MCI1995240.1 energy-coupling factor transporter transmembrane protein EcfT [Clostridium luticellarii]MCI2039763.1 energy-coupling factor transporter transmembrane protein EcfT [Clostridium luticellarii]PRR8
MIKDITIGQYVPGNSFIHKLDPRVKILISLIYIVDLFIVNSFKGYIFIVVFTVFSILISKVQFVYIYKGLKPVFILVLITAVLNMFMTGGVNPPLFKWKFLVVYREGLIMAAFMAIRLIFLIIGTSLLTLTTSPIELTDGIEKLLNPLKKVGVPAHELAMMMTIALRFIPTLMDETDKIMKAQMARGADFQSGSIIQRAKSLVPILVPLFISSFRRADELAMAMEARCYRGGEGRTRMKQLKLTNRDFVASACTAALVFISVLGRMWWH